MFVLRHIQTLVESLIPAKYKADEELLRAAKILVWTNILGIPFIVMQTLVIVFTTKDIAAATTGVGIAILMALILLAFNKGISHTILVNILLTVSVAVFVVFARRDGGIYAPIFPLIVLYPIIALMLTNAANSIFWLFTTLCALVYLYITTLLANPLYVNIKSAYIHNFFSMTLVEIGFAFVVVYVSDRARRNAQRETRAALEKLQNTQQMLMRQERLASFGQLAAGMAHEFQNPLNFINNFSDMSVEQLDELRELVKDNPAAMEMISELETNLKKVHGYGIRASDILKGMLEQTRVKGSESKPVNISHLSREFMHHAYYAFRSKYPHFECSMPQSFAAEIPLIDLPEKDLARVLMNVFQNAFQAVMDIETRREVYLKTYLDGGFAVIEVSDNGKGIAAVVLPQIFEPFYTTRKAGDGTGLGLSLAKDIMAAMGGDIIAQNSTPGGATFKIRLPLQ